MPLTDPQAALAARYFVDGSRLDVGDERQMDEAAAAYRKALIIDPDLVPAIVNLANIHYALDELIEAQALYERAIGLDRDCFEAYFNLGNIHHDLGRYEDALVCYRGAVRLNGGYPDAHFYLAVTLEKTGHSAEAKSHWKAYLELAPQGNTGQIWRGNSWTREPCQLPTPQLPTTKKLPTPKSQRRERLWELPFLGVAELGVLWELGVAQLGVDPVQYM